MEKQLICLLLGGGVCGLYITALEKSAIYYQLIKIIKYNA